MSIVWMTTSPPPVHNFDEIPTVQHRDQWGHLTEVTVITGRLGEAGDPPLRRLRVVLRSVRIGNGGTQPLGNNGDFVSISGHYNQNRNNFLGSVPLRLDLFQSNGTTPREAGTQSFNRFPFTNGERFSTIVQGYCAADVPTAGGNDTPATYAAVGFLKRREGVDVYDEGTDFTPFRARV